MQERMQELINALNTMWTSSNMVDEDAMLLTRYITDLFSIEPDVDNYHSIAVDPNSTIAVSNIMLLDQRFKPNLARFLNIMLRAENYDLLYMFFDRAFIHHVCGTIHVSRNANTFSMAERSFDRFVEAIKFTEYFEPEDILPMLLNIVEPNNQSVVGKWRRPSLDYIAEIHRQNDGRYEDYIVDNYDKFGLNPLEVLYNLDNKLAVEKVLRLYMDRPELRNELKDFLKLHSGLVLQELQLNAENLPPELYVELLLIFTHIRDVHPMLINIYNNTTSPVLKRKILDKVDVPIEMSIKTLAQFNRACNRYTFDDNIVLGKALSDYPILDTPAGALIPNATQMLLNKYIQLCSPKASRELDYFKEYVGETALENLCDVVLEQYIQYGTLDDEWAITMMVSNYSNTKIVDLIYVMFDALYKDRYRELEQFVNICIQVKRAEIEDILIELDKTRLHYPKIAEVMLTYLSKANTIQKHRYELVVDKMVPTFGVDEDRRIGYDTAEGMFYLQIKRWDDVQIITPLHTKIEDIGEKKRTQILRIQKVLYRELSKQARRLQEAFWDNRKWCASDFEQIMLDNPILNTLAEGLLWARYVGDSIASIFMLIGREIYDVVTFRAVPNSDVEIGIFHPVENNARIWREVIDMQKAPFNQLDVEIFPIDTFNKFSSVVSRFRGNIVNAENFEQKMLQNGWQYALQSAQNGTTSFVRVNKALGLIAELEYVPFGKQMDIIEWSLGDLRFYKLTSAVRVNKQWQTDKTEAMNIGNIPQRFFSDTLYDVSVASKK